MSLEFALQNFPKTACMKDGADIEMHALEPRHERGYHEFFLSLPELERMFIKHRVTEAEVIRQWCARLDYYRVLPLLAWRDDTVVGAATLHQQAGGWKRHIGRVSVFVHPEFRNQGIARALIREIMELARFTGLDRLEAEFVGEQEAAMKSFAMLGFSHLLRLEQYVKDMQARPHDLILMGLCLCTDEEYAGTG